MLYADDSPPIVVSLLVFAESISVIDKTKAN